MRANYKLLFIISYIYYLDRYILKSYIGILIVTKIKHLDSFTLTSSVLLIETRK